MNLLKSLGAPGSIPLLLIGAGLSLVWLWIWPRSRRFAQKWFASVIGVYVVLSLPIVAHGIAGLLPPITAATYSPDDEIEVLIVFDGDNRRGRVAETKRIADIAKPKEVLLLGNPWMWDALWRAGVPYDLIKPDPRASNTLEQVEWVRRFQADGGTRRAALVASRLQMPRVQALAAAAGVEVLLAPSPADTEPATTGLWQFVPTYYALRISRDALYEHAALIYYGRKGWVR